MYHFIEKIITWKYIFKENYDKYMNRKLSLYYYTHCIYKMNCLEKPRYVSPKQRIF